MANRTDDDHPDSKIVGDRRTLGTGVHGEKDKPTGEWTVGDLLSHARPKDVWGFAAGLGVLLAMAFGLGMKVQSFSHPLTAPAVADTDPLGAFNDLQLAIARRDSVRVIKQYLNAVADDDWEGAYSLIYTGSKYMHKDQRKSEPLINHDQVIAWLQDGYRTTKGHTFGQFIPVAIGPDVEQYDLDLTFYDWLPTWASQDELCRLPLGECLTDVRCAKLADDLLRALPENFEVPDFPQHREELRTELLTFVKQDVKLKELVLNDEILDRFANAEKGFKPIVVTQDRPEKGGDFTMRRRMVSVTVRRENSQWKFDEYGSYLVEKR